MKKKKMKMKMKMPNPFPGPGKVLYWLTKRQLEKTFTEAKCKALAKAGAKEVTKALFVKGSLYVLFRVARFAVLKF